MKLRASMALAMALLPAAAIAQDENGSPPAATEARALADVPFGVGERMNYRVKFGPLVVGEAQMEVVEIDTVAGHPTYHLRSVIQGATFFYKLDDRQESWLDVYQLASRRFRQDSQQGDYERFLEYEIDLEGGFYTRNDGAQDSIPEGALDEAAFVFFVRTIDLQVGRTYTWNRYFRFDRNPVVVKVLRREKVKVPAGEFQTVVVRPIIKTRGIFSEGGEAEIYITDDERRMPVQLRSKLKVGSVTMELTGVTEGDKLTAEMLRSM